MSEKFIHLIKSYSNHLLICFAIFTCIISFQNCTVSPESDGQDTQTSIVDDPNPFAYKLDIDHLAFMTCPTNDQSINSGGFTIKWGAYANGLATRKGGLGFSKEWLDKYGKYEPSAMASFLIDSPKNKNINIVSGYFKNNEFLKGNLSGVWGNSGINMSSNPSIMPIDSYNHQLLERGQELHTYFPKVLVNAAGAINRIEGVLYRDPVTAQAVGSRDMFTETMKIYHNNQSAQLRVGFTNASKIKTPFFFLMDRDGSYKDTVAVGSSFRFSFEGFANKDRFLKDVIEKDLQTNMNKLGSWTCPEQLRFKIVRKQDLGKGGTPAFNPSRITSSIIARGNTPAEKTIQTVTNVIDPTHWDIDFTARLIVRKSVDTASYCYNKQYNSVVNDLGVNLQIGLIAVDYSETRCGSFPDNFVRVSNSNTWVHYVCPHYVSVCVKN